MKNLNETSSAETESPEAEATSLINEVTTEQAEGGSVTPEVLATRIEIAAALRPEGVQDLVHEHTVGLREDLESDAEITKLREGVGGQTDGNTIEIATDTVLIDATGIHSNRDQRRNVNEHEVYHRENGHLDPVVTYVSENANTAVIIGGESFSDEAITEAVTVIATNGEKFVSGQYNEYVDRLRGAIANSDTTFEEVAAARNNHDLTDVDDRKEQGKPDPVLAT